mmetsp:Transcript_11842/g.14306  ORF Transcript_11842/g.14306 Transcript_11842/m.14306 type:complete len:99 (+) Transcript_11842:1143-1439(+)
MPDLVWRQCHLLRCPHTACDAFEDLLAMLLALGLEAGEDEGSEEGSMEKSAGSSAAVKMAQGSETLASKLDSNGHALMARGKFTEKGTTPEMGSSPTG